MRRLTWRMRISTMRHWSDMSLTIVSMLSSSGRTSVGPNTIARLRASICRTKFHMSVMTTRSMTQLFSLQNGNCLAKDAVQSGTQMPTVRSATDSESSCKNPGRCRKSTSSIITFLPYWHRHDLRPYWGVEQWNGTFQSCAPVDHVGASWAWGVASSDFQFDWHWRQHRTILKRQRHTAVKTLTRQTISPGRLQWMIGPTKWCV